MTSLHVVVSPYTKVEETPALHAVHDILAHGIGLDALQQYDHIVYPGPVARSMIPNLLLAAFTYPLSLVTEVRQGLPLQVLIRLIQSFFFSASLVHLSNSISLYYQSQLTSQLFLILSLTQFHIPYYAGRTLPNFTALPFTLFGISLIMRPSRHSSRPRLGLTLISLTGTVARMEIAPIALALALTLIWERRLSVWQALSGGAYGGIIGLAMTSTIDTRFLSPSSYPCDWWPELSAAIFNIVHGKSKDWGVMPWWHYLPALCKLCLASAPLALVGCYISLRQSEREREMLKILLGPVMGLVGILSMVKHKEWRFVVYAVPLINIIAARGACFLWSRQSIPFQLLSKPIQLQGLFIKAIVLLLCFCNIGATIFFSSISRLNYPGGEIGQVLVDLAIEKKQMITGRPLSMNKAWFSASALHSGVTLFILPENQELVDLGLEISRPESAYERCTYPFGNSPKELWDDGYMWVVNDEWEEFESCGEEGTWGWKVVKRVTGYGGIDKDGVKMVTRLAIMERKYS
ncbi:alpha-1,6-mannosyltransferase [Cryptococcus neoformans Bt85]|nr:alpha-1,6-mannosyltransferase [Cryptococcus neoformans var. grubii Bt85]